MRAIMVSVGMSDILAVTLPRNRHHFSEVCVVTSTKDDATKHVCHECDALPFVTDCFWDDGAAFAKWKALEKGLDAFGRDGVLCIMDCDVIWPKVAPVNLKKDQLFSPLRHVMSDTSQILSKGVPPESEWFRHPIHRNIAEHAGYSQVFSADSFWLGDPPWHETNWRHCGGADSFFSAKCPSHLRVRPSWNCLHLGPCGVNWLGRTSPNLDGSLPPDSQRKADELQAILPERRARERRGEDKFGHERVRP